MRSKLHRLIRRRFTWPQLVGAGMVVGVFAIGLVTVLQKIGNQVTTVVQTHGNSASNVKQVDVLSVDRADFDYFVPASSDAWKFDAKTAVFDKTSGVVKYGVQLTYAGITVTISQQKFPDALKPRSSSKFSNFVDSFNPSRTQDSGRGTVYFKATLQNGAAANGSDTVMYATDDVLMFAQAGSVLGYDAWSKLLTAMQPH